MSGSLFNIGFVRGRLVAWAPTNNRRKIGDFWLVSAGSLPQSGRRPALHSSPRSPVGMPPRTLRVPPRGATRSVADGIPTGSVGTRGHGAAVEISEEPQKLCTLASFGDRRGAGIRAITGEKLVNIGFVRGEMRRSGNIS